MSTGTAEFNASAEADRILAIPNDESRNDALKKLSNSQRKKVKQIMRDMMKDNEESQDDEEEVDWSRVVEPGSKRPTVSQQQSGGVRVTEVVVTEAELDTMWSNIDSNDLSGVDLLGLADFDYIGFNADLLLKEFVKRGKQANRSTKEILSDLTCLAALAHKKGSITEKNYPKMNKAGQTKYDELAARYGIVKGGGKGKGPEVITVSRIGPTVPGRIIRLIQAGHLAAKKFNGPLKSSSMPDIIQTQAFPVIIPNKLEQEAKDFLIGLCVAYSSDQSYIISERKKKIEDAVGDQRNFIELSMSTSHPTESMRIEMFKTISWTSFYDKSITCANAYQKLVSDFTIPTKTDFLRQTSSV
jgi:hypothetical protein